ncbi:MnhB domain-containing protein [Staphylothermus hellenicus]|uniref:Na+/H+ antiporter MnhB subunit-related protein n=1 Tax=Staphylothermus hellenicus (strain DSM 12710 / JCM 10830 / BK20S6-10-b1 / P8) TaxID=591019 RepID=D7DAT4_STAHD|nr:MnhB domain-containing protein [Staphylothermus hellenicus]ADI31281.1 Na+/H+ antiporter MnhB subunit-related protein [Staphylothermus hellenicus DSM 12710]
MVEGKVSGRDVLLSIVAASIIVILSYVLVSFFVISIPPQETNRWLANWFLTSTYNWENKEWWSGSPEVVTSILWDYRGLDTVYETSVFFFAIIGGLMLVRSVKIDKESLGIKGMSVISKTVTKIILVAVPVVAASVALHGHLTPGGGFQGGSIFAVSSLLAIVALGTGFLYRRGWTKMRLLGFRTLGLLIISTTVISLFVVGVFSGITAYIVQNQWKPWAPIGMGYLVDLGVFGNILYSGSLIFLNLAEFLAVSAGLSLAFIIMALPKKKLVEGGDIE